MKVTAILGEFDWFGCEVTHEENGMAIIREGRVGCSDAPLTITENGVSGGYYLPETSVFLSPSAQFVDVVLHETSQTLFVVVRSDPWSERLNEQYRILFPLMQKETDDTWSIAEKEYLNEEVCH